MKSQAVSLQKGREKQTWNPSELGYEGNKHGEEGDSECSRSLQQESATNQKKDSGIFHATESRCNCQGRKQVERLDMPDADRKHVCA